MATNLLEHTMLSAHDPKTGRYDAKRLAAALAITNAEMAEIVGYTSQGWLTDKTHPTPPG